MAAKKTQVVRIGAHVEQTDPLAEAKERGCDAVQFFLGDPQGWKAPTVAYAGGADKLKADAQKAGVRLYVHAPYVLNVATANNRIRIPSRKLLQQHLDAAAGIGAAGLIVHGGHVTGKDDPDVGFDNWRKAVERTTLPIPMLIENTAGGDHAMARHLETIEKLWEAVSGADNEQPDNVGFCFDTCHFFAGGEDLGGLVGKVKKITGRIDLVHANNSRDAQGSGADRHANLDDGTIDPDEIVAVVKESGADAIIETPGDGHAADLATLRKGVLG